MRFLLGIASVLLAAAVALPARAESVTVSAAVSLKEAMTDAADLYARQRGDKVELNFGATGHLLAQIREGAPVDVFIAASDQQVDQAEGLDLVDRTTRTIVAGNRLVLIVPKDAKVKWSSFKDLSDPSVNRVAIGQPRTVPAGQYAAQVISALNLEPVLKDRLVYGASVRQVLDYVERGEVDAGVVYATDAKQAGEKVRVVATAEESWHDPIHYVAAAVRASKKSEQAKRFIEFLGGEEAQKRFVARGFTSRPAK